MAKHKLMSDRRRKICELDAESIAYYRRNPCIACKDLLGIKLIDAQKLILQESWNKPFVLWCCSRNFGKSFLGAIFMILKAVLYENQAIYIVSSVGSQTKETFTKIEEIVLRIGKTSASIRSLEDIVEHEIVKNPSNKTGFSHDPTSWCVEFFNGSCIYTLNSNPSNNRSKRASLIFFDESAYCSDELISACEAFATQSSEFATSTDENYNPDSERRNVPTQRIYASSQDTMDTMFYKHYKDYSKKMLAGNRDYYVCDMTCETAMTVYMEGKPYPPLLERQVVESARQADEYKCLREYYNEPTMDGGINQIVKSGTITRNETFALPQLRFDILNDLKYSYIFAFDPARTLDNSIFSTMRIYKDKNLGWMGDVINCINFLDKASKKGYKLDQNRQLEIMRDEIYKYSNEHLGYENIDMLLCDAGAGGGGNLYADNFMNEWVDMAGRTRRGFIDKSIPEFARLESIYPNTVDKIRRTEPKKYRTQMCKELIELMDLGVIKFPYSFKKEIVNLIEKDENGMEKLVEYQLSDDEIIALKEIELMKREVINIYKYESPDKTSISYHLPPDKETKMHKRYCA